MAAARWLGTASVWAAAGTWALLAAHATVTDLRERRISRTACWAAAVLIAVLLAVAAIAYGRPAHLLSVAAGAAAVLIAGEVLYRSRPGAVGYGDIRLINASSILTAWWGPQWPWWALLAGAAFAVPQAAAAHARHGGTAAIAWAPALAAGTALIALTRLAAHGTAP